MKPGSTNLIIELDVPSGASHIDTEIIENSPVFTPTLQEQAQLNYNQESKLKHQEWNKRIANKKSLMTIILNQYDKATRAEISLG